jgi:hypothetical protein
LGGGYKQNPGGLRRGNALARHCEEQRDEAIQLPSREESWIASRSLSSGAHSRDPLARNDGRWLFEI